MGVASKNREVLQSQVRPQFSEFSQAIESVVFHMVFHHGGRLGPPMSDMTFFGSKGGQLGPPVSDVTFFGSWKSVGAPRE